MHPNSDARNKEIALSRIRQLSSSGLSLEPFIRNLFEVIGEAVPSSPHRAIHTGAEQSDAYIASTPEIAGIISLHNHYIVESPPEVSGARFQPNMSGLRRILPTKTI